MNVIIVFKWLQHWSTFLIPKPGVLITTGLICQLALIPKSSLAQSFTVSGYITDSQTGESLIGANVYHAQTRKGAATNSFGFYSITFKADTATLTVSYVGYQSAHRALLLSKDTSINIDLTPKTLEEVVITAEGNDDLASTKMSTYDIPIQQMKKLPALLGEMDVLKVLQLLPGVQSGNEGSSGLYVRGGGADQNLILIDGAPVYNASHLFGFFSVFNGDAIKKVELIKGGFPARYGGRLSSVIDINMKDGNMKKIKGEGSLGLIASKISIEGPIKTDKASFIISARRTYVDLLARPFIKSSSNGELSSGYYFYDFNSKFNYKVNEHSRIFLSTYTGSDVADSEFKSSGIADTSGHTESTSKSTLTWSNVIASVRWSNEISQKLFTNTMATFSYYRFNVGNSYNVKTFGRQVGGVAETSSDNRYVSGIRDWTLKEDLDWIPASDHYIRFGAGIIDHLFTPGVSYTRSSYTSDATTGSQSKHAQEFSGYGEDDVTLTSRLKVNAGVHLSGFYVDHVFYHSIQPRFSFRYLVNDMWSVKTSYARMTQFIHLLTNAGISLPTDLWVPATGSIKPQQSQQVAIGIVRSFGSAYEVSLESYYKTMNHVIEYNDGASFLNIDKDWQNKVVAGKGRGRGVELLIQKKTGNLTGWIGYTLSKTDRKFGAISNGNWFPYRYDRRHDASVALTYKASEKIDISLAWVFGTGNAVSLPTSSYTAYNAHVSTSGGDVQYYGSRNNFRMRAYNRLDLGISFVKKKKWGERKWTIGIYNAYNRMNPFYLDIANDVDGRKTIYQYSFFPIIPSISYGFKF